MLKEEKTTVRTIASRLGLSPATVSLALNGRRPTGFVSIATRRQVWHAAEEMGYPLDRLRSRRPLLERVAIFTNGSMVYVRSILELSSALNRAGVQVLIHSVGSPDNSGDVAREMFRKQEIDAGVFVGSRHNDGRILTRESFDDMPYVVIGEVPEGSSVWQVRADNEVGGRAVGEHLWSLGHRSVGMIFPLTDTLVAMRRLSGLRSVWTEHGESTDDWPILRTDTGRNDLIRDAVTEFVPQNRQSSNPVTALVCFNDWIAGMTINTLRHLDISVPEQIAVTGFDDENYSALLDPQLTTVHQPFDSIGQIAAELLLRQAESPGTVPEARIVPCHLVVRGSTGAPAPIAASQS